MKLEKKILTILLASPRGFCAGVDRAIKTVELALQKFQSPIYVRHEIVHNKEVVNKLKTKGAIFVDELSEVPEKGIVILSAHGVPKLVIDDARRKNLIHIDATCPLVTKVHVESQKYHKMGLEILLIGHANHPEVVGTMGQIPKKSITLIEDEVDARKFTPIDKNKLALITQTTLSVDDTSKIITILKARFPKITLPHKEDICYATTNRQKVVKNIAPNCDTLIVIGSTNSSNSKRLVEVAIQSGCKNSFLLDNTKEVPWKRFKDTRIMGLTAGASAPEYLISNLIQDFKKKYNVKIKNINIIKEEIEFKLPEKVL